MNQQAREAAKQLVRTFFKNDYGQPFELTDGQADIFMVIFLRLYPRNQIIASTQYGKSDTVAMALIMRSQVYKEKWAILSGDAKKAGIIMGKVIQHTFDHPRFAGQLALDPNQSIERLKRERSQEKLTWLNGGSIQIFTANSRNKNAVKEALTGFGSPNIVEDEASLIPNDVQSMVLRMLGGHPDNFLVKIGNPFYRNHFHKTWHSDKYFKLLIDYQQGLREGRYTPDFIEEMRLEVFFDVLYECKFPDSSEITSDGYRQLIPDELLERAWISEEEAKPLMIGRTIMGGDFAGGGNDSTAHVIRWPKVMKLVHQNYIADTMKQVPIVQETARDYNVQDEDINLDYGGLGQGVGDRLKEISKSDDPDDLYEPNLVMFGASAPEHEKKDYKNIRAYMYFKFKRWLEDGGRIVRHDGFLQLLSVNYKVDSEKKRQIQPKEELKKVMQKLGLSDSSPDVADAGALTFAGDPNMVTEDDIDIL